MSNEQMVRVVNVVRDTDNNTTISATITFSDFETSMEFLRSIIDFLKLHKRAADTETTPAASEPKRSA
jgi:pterin-4a-carbinolamine dehydratase